MGCVTEQVKRQSRIRRLATFNRVMLEFSSRQATRRSGAGRMPLETCTFSGCDRRSRLLCTD
jgi:hypothetical protein